MSEQIGKIDNNGDTKNHSPKYNAFTKRLTNSEFGLHLNQIEQLEGQNYIVRGVDMAYDKDVRIDTANHAEIYRELEQEGEKKSKKLLELIRCDVTVAPTYFVTGESSYGLPTLYMATAKVEGSNVEEVDRTKLSEQESEEIYKQAEKLIDGLIKYLHGSILSREVFLTDVFHLRQYVYGNIKSVSQKKIYLVDTEILYPKAEYGFSYQVQIAIVWLRNMLDDLEYRLDISLTEQRNSLAKLIEGLSEDLQNPDFTKIVKELRDGINLWHTGERYDPNKQIQNGRSSG